MLNPVCPSTRSAQQALYFCEPLRHHLAELREEDAHEANGGAGTGSGTGSTGASKASGASSNGSSLIMQLADLFALISRQKRRSGYLAPTDFLRTLRERNELFRGNMQQVSEHGLGDVMTWGNHRSYLVCNLHSLACIWCPRQAGRPGPVPSPTCRMN